MNVSRIRSDVVYERSFREPVFTLGKSAAEILGAFYKALSPEFRLAMSDLTVPPANTMGDLSIRASLFNGNGILEVNVDRFSARFFNLQSDEDIEIVKSVMRLSEISLTDTIKEIVYSDTIIRTSSWIEFEDTDDAAKKILAKYSKPRVDIDHVSLGAEEINHSIRSSVYNGSAGWAINFGLEISELPGYHIYFLCNAAYAENGAVVGFDAVTGHFEDIHRRLLESYEFYPASKS